MRWSSAIAVVPALVLAGCGGPVSDEAAAADGLFVAEPTNAVMAAGIGGTLLLIDDGPCLALGVPGESKGSVPASITGPILWPDGTTALREGDRLAGARWPDGTEVRIGDQIDGGGGYLSAADMTTDRSFPRACFGSDDTVVVLQTLG